MRELKSDLTAARLREVMSYDPKTGTFERRIHGAWNAKGSAHAKPVRGYVRLHVDGRQYFAHRLAWLYIYGCWPRQWIDHINGVRSDNRIENLREADSLLNRENQHVARSDNQSSGVLGVHWSAYHNKWKAHIRVCGKLRHLKYCATIEEAQSVYVEAKRRLHAGCTI